jgi:Calcineurin-like phosphoesterase
VNLSCRCFAGLLLVLLAIAPWPSNAAVTSDPTDQVVAVGDVHGEFDGLCGILRRAGLVDDQNHWIGGKATLVQTGDLIDRGSKGREAMDLLISLQAEANKAGGRVVPLLGNHEVMNVLGDLRYVTPQAYAEFADSKSEKRRKDAHHEFTAWMASHEKSLAAIKDPGFTASEPEWMAQHPAGFLEYRDAFRPRGRYGKWIRQHAVVTNIRGIIFLHGGIAPALTAMSLQQINGEVHKEIDDFDATMQELISRKVVLPFFTLREVTLAVQLELLQERSASSPPDAEYHNRLVRLLDFNKWLCMSDQGPLWFRGYDEWSDEQGSRQTPKILAAYNAQHIVVAHTVQKALSIRSRFGGAVFLIDTGMLSTYWHGGRASALEFQKDGKIIAQYLDRRELMLDERPAEPPKPN